MVTEAQVSGPIPVTATITGTGTDPKTDNNTAGAVTLVNLTATPNANALLKVITEMDNTNAPPALQKRPEDFTLVVAGSREYGRFTGSSIGTFVGGVGE